MAVDTATTNGAARVHQDDALLGFARTLDELDAAARTAVTSRRAGADAAEPRLRTDGSVRPPTRPAFSEIVRLLKGTGADRVGPAPAARVVVTDRWEGVVTAVDGDTFDGEFVPVGSQQPRMRATFLVTEVDPDDLELLHSGALFYIVASRIQVSARRWQPSSAIQFRRIPGPSYEDGVEALERAQKLRQKMGLSH